MIVNSNHPHTYKQYMTTLRTPSESSTDFDTFFRRPGQSLNHCIQLTSLRGGTEALLHHCPHRVYEKVLQRLPHQNLAHPTWSHHVWLDLRTQYRVGHPFSVVENMSLFCHLIQMAKDDHFLLYVYQHNYTPV